MEGGAENGEKELTKSELDTGVSDLEEFKLDCL